MITIYREIWNCDKGIIKKKYTLDINSKIKLIKEGKIYAYQVSKFENVFKDWNNDGDEYELYGAYFNINGFEDFYTPENIVSLIEDKNLKIEYEN